MTDIMDMAERVAVLRIENERLLLENWQLKSALGYPVPSDIREGRFMCGLCETRRYKEAQEEISRIAARLPEAKQAKSADVEKRKAKQ